MKRMMPVSELARDERFHHMAVEDVIFDPRNANPQAKINTLDASGGGTLYWPAGDYTLTSAITLKPKVKNVALGAVRVFRSHNTAGVPMFYPDDDCSFEGFHLEPYPVGVTTVANYDLFTLNGTKGKNVTLTGCHLEHGTIGEWASENFVVFECTGDRFALNQLKGNTTVLNYRGSGMFSHPISSWEGRDIAIVNTELEGTDRGIVIQPSRGSSSILAYRVTIRDVNQVANGAEGLSLEGGNNWDSVPFTQNDSTHVTLSRAPAPDPTIPYSPVPSITPFQTHAFFRYAGGQGEAIRITAYNSSTKQVTLERPKRGTAAVANVELVWGHVESEFVRIRKSGGATAPAFVMFRGFTHGIYVNDYQGNDGGAISFHRNPDSRLARNTQQQNWFNNCQFRLPVWQFQYPNDNPDDPNQSIYQVPGGAFYYESSAAYNLVSNTVVELPSVNNSSQMFMIWEAMGVPVVQRCLGTNSGNLMSRSFVKGAKPYVLNRGGVLRNCVSDYLRVTTSNVLGNTRDLTYDGNTPSVSFPLSRIAVPPGESWMCILNVVARQRENGSSKIWSFAFGVQNYNGATNLIGTGGVRNLITPDASPAWTCTVTADDTNDALKVSCVGASGATIDWEGSLEVVRAAP